MGNQRLSGAGGQQEDEESGIGDVDLFTLSEDKSQVTVNAKWLQHLQVSARACTCACALILYLFFLHAPDTPVFSIV